MGSHRQGGSSEAVFEGYYGMRNTGDDAFCVVADSVARSRWGSERTYFVARTDDLPPGLSGLIPEPRFRGHVRLAPLPRMVRARNVVHVGGSTFMSSQGRHRDEARLAAMGLIDLHAVGVSVGPFADQESARRVARALRRFSTISLRDSASATRLAEIDSTISASVGFDVAVLLSNSTLSSQAGQPAEPLVGQAEPVLGVSLCAHEALRDAGADTEQLRYTRTARCVRAVVRSTGCRVRLLVFNDHPHWGDLALTQRLADDLEGVAPVDVVMRTRDPRTMLDAVSTCDVLLATRLHSAVFAYAAHVPFLVVAYQQKSIDFASEVGLPDELVHGADGPNDDAVDQLVRMLDEPGRCHAQLPTSIATERAEGSFPSLGRAPAGGGRDE